MPPRSSRIPNRPGLYVVRLLNDEPMSVNRGRNGGDGRGIKVTKLNCKIGRAKSLLRRSRAYEGTFGPEKMVFCPIILTESYEQAELLAMAELHEYRIRGTRGDLNEWLVGIEASAAAVKALEAVQRAGIPFEPVSLNWEQEGSVTIRRRQRRPRVLPSNGADNREWNLHRFPARSNDFDLRELSRSEVVIVKLPNPKRPGTKAHKRFESYLPGKTVQDNFDAGVWEADIRWDLKRGYIELMSGE